MKKVLVGCLFFLGTNLFAQKELYIKDVDISKIATLHYIEVAFVYKAIGINITAINYGQKLSGNDNGLYENGEKKGFKNHIEMLNYFYMKGWTLKQEISRTEQYNYILERSN